jgi:hypothetical protein
VAPKAKRPKAKAERVKSTPAKTVLKRAILTAIRGTSRVWTVEDLMAATQCTDQELLNRCCDELIDDGHLRPKLLPLRLMPEQAAEIAKAEEESRRRSREIDRANTIRDGLRERQAPTKFESASKNPRGAGAKPKFQYEFILIEAAVYVVTNGLPPALEDLVHALQLEHGAKMPRDTQGKEILRHFFERMKQALGR